MCMTKIARSEKIYLWVKNDVLEDGGAVLINSARIYCDAMDQVSSMGYSGWIRERSCNSLRYIYCENGQAPREWPSRYG